MIPVALLSAVNIDQGIDKLELLKENLRGKRVALLAHAASVNKHGHHLIDLSFDQFDGLSLIFSPEHGVRSRVDDYVDDDIDSTTGLPIISLYKKQQRAPSDEDIKKFDAIIIDLKDVGTRFYTYGTTMFLTIKKCIENNKQVYILDRINPLGSVISGPILDKKLSGHTISFFEVPMNHGQTLGELMNYSFSTHMNKKFLNIIPISGWNRNTLFHDNNINWISPSPALIDYSQAYLYSIFGAFESLNLSVGRGKTNAKAFKYFGAPWISKEDAIFIAKKLNDLKINGLIFTPTEWTVTRSIYEGEIARGFKVDLIDFKNINRFETLYRTLQVFYLSFKEKAVFNDWVKRYLGSELIHEMLINGIPYEAIKRDIENDERAFQLIMKRYQLY